MAAGCFLTDESESLRVKGVTEEGRLLNTFSFFKGLHRKTSPGGLMLLSVKLQSCCTLH